MHNKSWIADNRIAIVGGRNVGDEYFGASEEMNFVDLDFAMLGPIVRDVSASFDRYWNSPSAYPMEVLDPEGVSDAALAKLRKATCRSRAPMPTSSRYADALRGDDVVQRMLAGEWPMQWSAKYQFVSDDPPKVTMKKRRRRSARTSASPWCPWCRRRASRVAVISPYFVPGDEVTAGFASMAGAGKASAS